MQQINAMLCDFAVSAFELTNDAVLVLRQFVPFAHGVAVRLLYVLRRSARLCGEKDSTRLKSTAESLLGRRRCKLCLERMTVNPMPTQ